MAHHPGGAEANENKVELRFFAMAETEILDLDKLMVKEVKKQVLKGSEKCVSLAEELRNSKEKIGKDCLEGSNDAKTVRSKGWSGKVVGAKKTGKQVLSRKGLDHEVVCARNMGEKVTHFEGERGG